MAIDDELTQRILYCVIRVHQILGPGFVEKIYRRALVIELRKQGLAIEIEKVIPIYYDNRKIGVHVLDILVEGRVIIELKIVDALSKAHYAQVRSYLRATNIQLALLINFAGDRADFRRIHLPIAGSASSPSPEGRYGDDGDSDSESKNEK